MADSFEVQTPDGRTLGVCTWGDPNGAPMIWLHGTPGSRFLRHTGDGYLRHRIRVITFDRPGYGLSTRRPGRRMVDAADDVRTVADALGLERFGIAGPSGGASCALGTAATLPDRVERCVTCVGHAPFKAPGLDLYAGMDEQAVEMYRIALRGEAALLEDWREAEAWIDAGLPGVDLDEEAMQMLKETMDEARRQGPWGFVDDWLSEVDDWGFAMGDVSVPTRLLLGRQDTSVPAAHGEWLVEHLPDAELITLDGGHFGPFGEPEMELFAWCAHGAVPEPHA
jgi:pimeloyl-ACP methyl ester carboxylesterase